MTWLVLEKNDAARTHPQAKAWHFVRILAGQVHLAAVESGGPAVPNTPA